MNSSCDLPFELLYRIIGLIDDIFDATSHEKKSKEAKSVDRFQN